MSALEEIHKLRIQVERLSRDNELLLQTFGHDHIAGDGDIDKCLACGLDFRHPIHTLTTKPDKDKWIVLTRTS